MRILITGGAGFIGSNLSEYLLGQGHEVICLDDFYTGSKENISHLFENKHFKFVERDVRKPYDFKVEQIYNLACPASPVHYQKDPIRTLETNIFGAQNALNLAKETGARVLQSSTSEVYGDPLVHPQKEEYFGNVNPIGIRACYDEGKRAAETLFFDHNRQYGTDIKVVRIFNTYGPKMAAGDGRVVSNFIVQALQNEPLTIYGEGGGTRSFCYIDDLIKGLVAMMNSEGFSGPVNLGNPGEFTIEELARKVIKLTGSKSEIIYAPPLQDDPKRRRPNISLAKKMLGWQPEIPLEKGIEKTINYFKQIL